MTRSNEDGNAAEAAPRPVATATGVNTATTLLMTTSQSQMKSVNVSSRNKAKRAASFAEHPVVSAVSESIKQSIKVFYIVA